MNISPDRRSRERPGFMTVGRECDAEGRGADFELKTWLSDNPLCCTLRLDKQLGSAAAMMKKW